jgi:hypothetical protein
VRIAYERLRARLDSLVHSELAGALQETFGEADET